MGEKKNSNFFRQPRNSSPRRISCKVPSRNLPDESLKSKLESSRLSLFFFPLFLSQNLEPFLEELMLVTGHHRFPRHPDGPSMIVLPRDRVLRLVILVVSRGRERSVDLGRFRVRRGWRGDPYQSLALRLTLRRRLTGRRRWRAASRGGRVRAGHGNPQRARHGQVRGH